MKQLTLCLMLAMCMLWAAPAVMSMDLDASQRSGIGTTDARDADDSGWNENDKPSGDDWPWIDPSKSTGDLQPVEPEEAVLDMLLGFLMGLV